ncbi:MAG: hypothetical protein MHM6MM_002791 [Cercozoa sp. M6MM]
MSEPLFGVSDSNIDWCEEDYAVTPLVAEFWNTLSSLPMVFMGICLCVASARSRPNERRFLFAGASLAVVGAGSTLFHATMRRWAQAADELPMLYACAVLFYLLMDVPSEKQPKALRFDRTNLAIFCVVYAVGMTLLYACFPENYWIFLVGYSLLLYSVTGLSGANLYFRWKELEHTRVRKLFLASMVSYFSGVALWLIERRFCEVVRPLQLHAWWHVGAGVGTFLWINFAVALRAHLTRRHVTEHKLLGLLPLLHMHVAHEHKKRLD